MRRRLFSGHEQWRNPLIDEKDATLAARKVKMSKSRSDLESECYSIRQREDGFVAGERTSSQAACLKSHTTRLFSSLCVSRLNCRSLRTRLHCGLLSCAGLSPQNIARRLEPEYRGADAIDFAPPSGKAELDSSGGA